MEKRTIAWNGKDFIVSIVGESGGTHEAFELASSDSDQARDRELRPAEARLLVWKRHGFIPAADEIFSTTDLSNAQIRGILDLVEQQEKRAFNAGKDAVMAELRTLIGIAE